MMTDSFFDSGPSAPYANALKRDDGALIAVAGGDPALNLDFLRGDRYPNEEEILSSDYLDAANVAYAADARMWRIREGSAVPVYGRDVARTGAGRRWLQYWIFYYLNSKRFLRLGIHEGDWEMIQIGLSADDEPEVATYAQHGRGEKAEWKQIQTDEASGAPIVFVARDSHASQFRSGSHTGPVIDDYCNGNGKAERPDLKVISNDVPAWVTWPGKWGASREGKFQSPYGPAFQNAWRHPDSFHERASEFWEPRPRGIFLEAPETLEPANVEVRVAQVNGQRQIEYEVTGARVAIAENPSFAAELTIVVARPGDREPERLVFDVTTEGVKEPLPPP